MRRKIICLCYVSPQPVLLLFHLGNWRSAPPVPAEVHWENIGGSLSGEAEAALETPKLSIQHLCIVEGNAEGTPKSSRQGATQVMSWWIFLWLCAMANRAERKPRSNRSSTWVWQPVWMIPRLSREVSAFFFARVQKVTVKSQWLRHKKCWHPNWWLECFISKNKNRLCAGHFLVSEGFGAAKSLHCFQLCWHLVSDVVCVFLKWVW